VFAVSIRGTAIHCMFALQVTASSWESGIWQLSPRNGNPFSAKVFIGYSRIMPVPGTVLNSF
jgi:hypothetical protein